MSSIGATSQQSFSATRKRPFRGRNFRGEEFKSEPLKEELSEASRPQISIVTKRRK